MHRCPGIEQTLVSVPELFSCPHCDQEMEIWRDERKGTCSACTKRVARLEAMEYAVKVSQRHLQNPAGDEITLAVCEAVDSEGEVLYYERYEAVVPLSTIEHHSKYKKACEACTRHGTNLACPPSAPHFATTRKAKSPHGSSAFACPWNTLTGNSCRTATASVLEKYGVFL